jgi:hypothetical protein
LDPERAAMSTALLFEDLQRQGLEGATFEMNAKTEVPGFGTLTAPIRARLDGGRTVVIVLHLPFAPAVPVAPEWAGPAEFSISPQVLPIDELAVCRNLPRVSAQIIEALGLE